MPPSAIVDATGGGGGEPDVQVFNAAINRSKIGTAAGFGIFMVIVPLKYLRRCAEAKGIALERGHLALPLCGHALF